MGICRCTQQACNDTCTTDVDHLVNVLQLEKLNDHGNLPVRHDRDVNDNDELQLRRLHSSCSEKDEDRRQDPKVLPSRRKRNSSKKAS